MRRLMTFGVSTTAFVAILALWMLLMSSPDASAQSCTFAPPTLGACTNGVNENSAHDAGLAAYYGAYFTDITDAASGAVAIYGGSNNGIGLWGQTTGVLGSRDAGNLGFIPVGVQVLRCAPRSAGRCTVPGTPKPQGSQA